MLFLNIIKIIFMETKSLHLEYLVKISMKCVITWCETIIILWKGLIWIVKAIESLRQHSTILYNAMVQYSS